MPLGGVASTKSKAAMSEIPDYIEERIRRPAPDDCCVVANHREIPAPVISFGDVRKARMAVISLNPGSGKDMEPPRLADYDYLANAPLSCVQQVFDCHNRFFDTFTLRNKKRFFGRLEEILNVCGATYGGRCGALFGSLGKEPSAVSLELAQWTTEPSWNNLTDDVREKLLDDGVPFFTELLEKNPNIELLFGHGRTVLKTLRQRFESTFKVKDAGSITTNHGHAYLYCGELLGRRFIGWSPFLPNDFMTAEQKAELVCRVGELHRSGCP